MKTDRLTLILLCLLFCISIFSCSKDEYQPESIKSRAYRTVTVNEIPGVINHLQASLNTDNKEIHFSANESDGIVDYRVDWDKAIEYTDSFGNVSYTFSIVEESPSLYQFRNIVIRKYGEDSFSYPYLYTYEMSESFQEKYLKTFSIREFEGRVTKQVLLDGINSRKDNSANLDTKSGTVEPGDCPNSTTTVGSGNGAYGGGSSGGTQGPSGGTNPITAEVCNSYWYDFPDEPCIGGDGCVISAPSIFIKECYTVQLKMPDSNDCDEGETAVTRIVTRQDFEKFLANCENPKECMDEALAYFRKWGGEEGKAIADLIEELLRTPGLTLGDANQIYALALEFAKNLSGQYTMSIFSVDNVATILSFGINNNLGAKAQEILKSAVSRYASITAKTVTNAKYFFTKGARYSDKVIQQMSNADDIYHAFPQSVDGFATIFGNWSSRIGADGKTYYWLELRGSYAGKTGIFEYIKDAAGVINHRFFRVF